MTELDDLDCAAASSEEADAAELDELASVTTSDNPGSAEDGSPSFVGTANPAGVSRVSTRSARRSSLVSAVIVDQSEVFRTGLAHMLNGTRFRVRKGAATLSDISANSLNGSQCIALVGLAEHDAAATLARVSSMIAQHQNLHVMVLGERSLPEEVVAAIMAGVHGYMIKSEINSDALLLSLELILLGAAVLPTDVLTSGALTLPDPENHTRLAPPPLASEVPHADGPDRLSNREEMILEQLTRGASNKHIARALNITEATVKVHVKNLLRKIRVNNRTQAAVWARHRDQPHQFL